MHEFHLHRSDGMNLYTIIESSISFLPIHPAFFLGNMDHMATNSRPSARFFQNQTIFITGATGFLGFALVVKILRDAPCSRLFLLVRGGEE